MKVAIFGQGYVGLTLSIAVAKSGFNVVGFDTDKNLVQKLSSGVTHVPGIDAVELKALVDTQRYLPTTDFSIVQGAEILIIAVPTPLDKERNPDLTYLVAVCSLIAKEFKSKALIINESTSFPGTLRNVIQPILEESVKGRFKYASAPERVDPGNINWNLFNTPRVICGLTDEATEEAINFYSKFCNKIYQAPSVESL